MRLGVAYPQTDIGGNPIVLRDFAQAVEEIGYHHLATYDHVLGANTANRPDWDGMYTSESFFHEVFVLLGYLAGQTTQLELSPQVLILPQRQTALVAKQAATVDYLSNGRLRLGIGIGWNEVEFVCLGENFHNRGRRSEEQVEVMKRLWLEPHVNFKGKWHEIIDAGINPLPVQRPIPIWFGGEVDQTLQRIARLGDGWITLYPRPDDQFKQEIQKLRAYTLEAGRSEDEIGIDVWISIGGRTLEEWRKDVLAWGKVGITHLTLNTAYEDTTHQRIAGTTADEHIEAIRKFYETVKDIL